MHIDLSDILRCPADHEESSLVVTVVRMSDRHLMEGTLGCPICTAEYPVRDGIVDFRGDVGERDAPAPARSAADVDEARVLRAAALLGLGDAGRVVAIAGAMCDVAIPLGALAPVHVIAIDPATTLATVEHVSVLRLGRGLPFAPASLDGALLDADAGGRLDLHAILSRLKARGRLIAPAEVPVPDDVALLARDELEWVGERRLPTSTPVALKRAR